MDMAEKQIKGRDVRLDYLRIFALFCVTGAHFFLNSGFMEEPTTGAAMYFMNAARSFFVVCVHLFVCLTGYLMCEKTVSKRYFFGIFKVLTTYVICSAVYALFRVIVLHEQVSVMKFLGDLLGYRGTSYAWYIEMYIGLFLLIPFLNLIFNNLKTRRQALLLLIVLFVLTGLPSTFNGFSFESLEVWKHPELTTRYDQLFPGWWDKLWPLFCYYLGCYLKKYPVRINLGLHVALLVGACAADGALNFYKSQGQAFVGASWNYNSAATVLVIAALLFSLLLRIRVGDPPPAVRRAAKAVSDSVLGAYLLSCIFDRVYYSRLAALVPSVRARFLWAPVIVIAVFLSSIALSLVINFARRLIRLGAGRIITRIKQKKSPA